MIAGDKGAPREPGSLSPEALIRCHEAAALLHHRLANLSVEPRASEHRTIERMHLDHASMLRASTPGALPAHRSQKAFRPARPR